MTIYQDVSHHLLFKIIRSTNTEIQNLAVGSSKHESYPTTIIELIPFQQILNLFPSLCVTHHRGMNILLE